MSLKRRIGFLFVLLEILWVFAWVGAMIAYNVDENPQEHFEQSHFDSIIHILGLPVVVATMVALQHGDRSGELADVRLLLFCLLGVALADCRGPVHAARLLHHVGWQWPLFTAIASTALALTGLEIIWFIWVTWELWARIPDEVDRLWNNEESRKSHRRREHHHHHQEPSLRQSLVVKY